MYLARVTYLLKNAWESRGDAWERVKDFKCVCLTRNVCVRVARSLWNIQWSWNASYAHVPHEINMADDEEDDPVVHEVTEFMWKLTCFNHWFEFLLIKKIGYAF